MVGCHVTTTKLNKLELKTVGGGGASGGYIHHHLVCVFPSSLHSLYMSTFFLNIIYIRCGKHVCIDIQRRKHSELCGILISYH